MKKVSVLFMLFFISGYLFAQTEYRVVSGDTVYGLSRKFGISQQQLLEANNMKSASELKAGQKLIIPEKNNPVGVKQEFSYYTIVKGDTLYSIARRFSITLDELYSLNNLTKNSVIKPGQQIKIIKKKIKPVEPSGAEDGLDSGTSGAVPNPPVKDSGKNDNDVPKNTDGGLLWPVSGKIEKSDGKLAGVKITGKQGAEVVSICSGQVVWAAPYRGYGDVIVIETASGLIYSYIGLGDVSVKLGDQIKKGGRLASLAVTYHDGVPSLYLTVSDRNKNFINPWNAPRK